MYILIMAMWSASRQDYNEYTSLPFVSWDEMLEFVEHVHHEGDIYSVIEV